MTDQGAQLHRLGELGLSTYEAKVYLALLARQSFSAAEVAAAAGIPRQRIYDVLGSLAARGLARDRAGQPTTYSAIAPLSAVDRLLGVQRRGLAALAERGQQLASDLTGLWEHGRDATSPLEYVEVLRDAALLAERFSSLQRGARHQLLTLAKPPYAATTNRAGLEATRKVAAGGGDVRCIYEPSVLGHAELLGETWEFVAAGEQARIVDQVPMKLCLVDSAFVLFSLIDPVAGALTSTNIVIEHPDMAATFRLAFDALWETGEPFEKVASRE
jgi:hypothetical protein